MSTISLFLRIHLFTFYILWSPAFGATVTVNPSGGGDATTINGALEMLAYRDGEDDLVLIEPGFYDEQVVLKGNAGQDAVAFPTSSNYSISKLRNTYASHTDHLTLMGTNPIDPPVFTVVNGAAEFYTSGQSGAYLTSLYIAGNGITLENIEIRQGTGTLNAVNGQASDFTYRDCVFSNGQTMFGRYENFISIPNNGKLVAHIDPVVAANNEYLFENCLMDGQSVVDSSLYSVTFAEFLGYKPNSGLSGYDLLGGVTMRGCIAKNFIEEVLQIRGNEENVDGLGIHSVEDCYFVNFPDSSILGYEGRQGRVNVQRCVFKDIPGWTCIGFQRHPDGTDSPLDVLIANNLFINVFSGLRIGLRNVAGAPRDWKVINNTFYDYEWRGIRIVSSEGSGSIQIANNILYGATDGAPILVTGIGIETTGVGTIDLVDNLFHNNVFDVSGALTSETGSVFGDPEFANILTNEPAFPGDTFSGEPFSLSVTSPAIDAGDSASIPMCVVYDLDGDARTDPPGGNVDIGAQEFGAGVAEPTCTPTPTLTPTATRTPTPTPSPNGFVNPPEGIVAQGGAEAIYVTWDANHEANLAGYNIYRDTNPGGSFSTLLNVVLLAEPEFEDTAVAFGTTYFYRATSVSTMGPESQKSEATFATSGSIKIETADVRGPNGATVTLPISLSQATGVAGDGMDISVLYDSSLLTPLAVQKSILTSSFTLNDNIPSATGELNLLTMAAPGVSMTGKGKIFDVVFEVSNTAVLGSTGEFSFSHTQLFNSTMNPLIVDFTDTSVLTVANEFILGDVDGNGVVDEADVTLACDIAVGLVTPTALQLQAGDINRDGVIDGADICLILRIIRLLPFNPPPGAFKRAKGAVSYEVSVGSGQDKVGSQVMIPVDINTLQGVAGIDLRINYDPAIATLADVVLGELTQSDFVLVYSANSNSVLMSISAAEASTGGNGRLVNLLFNLTGLVEKSSPLKPSFLKLSGQYGEDLKWSNDVTALPGLLGIAVPSGIDQTRWVIYK